MRTAPSKKHLLQDDAPHRLGQVVIHASSCALLSIALNCRCCHGHDGYVVHNILVGHMMSQQVCAFVAIDDRHLDIHQDYVRFGVGASADSSKVF